MKACSFPGVTLYLWVLMRANIGRGSGQVLCSLSVTFHVLPGLHILQLCRVFVPKQRGPGVCGRPEDAGGRWGLLGLYLSLLS